MKDGTAKPGHVILAVAGGSSSSSSSSLSAPSRNSSSSIMQANRAQDCAAVPKHSIGNGGNNGASISTTGAIDLIQGQRGRREGGLGGAGGQQYAVYLEEEEQSEERDNKNGDSLVPFFKCLVLLLWGAWITLLCLSLAANNNTSSPSAAAVHSGCRGLWDYMLTRTVLFALEWFQMAITLYGLEDLIRGSMQMDPLPADQAPDGCFKLLVGYGPVTNWIGMLMHWCYHGVLAIVAIVVLTNIADNRGGEACNAVAFFAATPANVTNSLNNNNSNNTNDDANSYTLVVMAGMFCFLDSINAITFTWRLLRPRG